MNPVLDIFDLTVRYRDLEAVRALTVHVDAGEIYGLLGPNGSGKSSTLGAVVGLVQPASGSITVAGLPAETLEAKAAIGFSPDGLQLPEGLTGRETLAFHDLIQPAFDDEFAHGLVEVLGLGSAMTKLVSEYSQGMKRKLRIIVAVAHRPRLLILDEPFSGLDPAASLTVRHLFGEMALRGTALVVATHDLLAAQSYCTRVGILSHGVLVAEGPPADLASAVGTHSLDEVFIAVTGLDRVVSEHREVVTALVDRVPRTECPSRP